MIVYISIGNSDDKLSQNEWAHFYATVDQYVRDFATQIHGRWLSVPSDPWQNACWCIELLGGDLSLRARLIMTADAYGQDSIAWAEAPLTVFIGGQSSAGPEARDAG